MGWVETVIEFYSLSAGFGTTLFNGMIPPVIRKEGRIPR